MTSNEVKDYLRKEQDILDRLNDVKRLIEMETTLMTVKGAGTWIRFVLTSNDGKWQSDDLLHQVRDEIQMQLLSIVALCYGDNPDIGEPTPILEWNTSYGGEDHPEDRFREVWDECLRWNS